MKKDRVLTWMWGAALAMLTLNACTDEVTQSLPEPQPDGDIRNVTFIAAGFDEDSEVQSRVDYTIGQDEDDTKKAFFAWALGDTIGILPAGAAQVYFKIAEIDETDPAKAKFTGVAWGLKSGVDYAAYYPFIQDIMLDRTEVPVDYSVQRFSYAVNEEGQLVASPSHNYQAAKPVPREDGGLNFEFKHLGGLVEVQFTFPEGKSGAVKQLHLMADEPIFPVKGTFNLEDETVAITPDETKLANSVTVNVSGLTAAADTQASVFFMMPPMASVDISKLSAAVVYGENNALLPLTITNLTDRRGDVQTSLTAAKYYTITTEAVDLPEAINIDDADLFASNIDEALATLGGTKLRFVTNSLKTSQTEVYSDNSETKAYAVRNGDWLEVHTSVSTVKIVGPSASHMFNGSTYPNFLSLQEMDLRGLDTSSVTDMSSMFYGCSSLTSLDLSSFDTSNVEYMVSMFSGCYSLESLDLSNFNTSNVTNMYYMFSYCNSLESLDLSKFDTSAVIDMSYMFNYCSALTELDLSSFDTSNVTDMNCMFNNCSSLTSLDLSSFNTSNVTYMNYMFAECSKLTSITFGDNFDTSNVVDIDSMFNNCSSLMSLDLSSFNTSKVSDISSMFFGCSSLTSLDLSKFDTSAVIDMSYMFDLCSALTELDLSNFSFDSNPDCTSMFYETGYDATDKPISIYVTEAGKTYLESQVTEIDASYAKLVVKPTLDGQNGGSW